jgi:hypothetical protein
MSLFGDYMSKSNTQAVIDWRKRTKQRIVESMGGECCECGYKLCVDALDLHHLDPSQKKFTFSGIRARPKSWATIVDELKKCILVCANCHREIEAGIRIPNKSESTFNTLYETYTPVNQFSRPQYAYKHKVKCHSCNTAFNAYRANAKYCSEICRSKK